MSVYDFVAGAKKSVDVVLYELHDATFEQKLYLDERRGVKVRVILDRAFAGASYNEPAFRFLRSHHVPVKWAPARTIVHEKAIVVDDSRALIATFNLGDTSDYYATTRDFGVFDTNPADVHGIARVFDSDWQGRPITQPPVRDRGADLVWSPGSEPALAALIDSAHHALLIENEEMGEPSIISELIAAARRGVNVEIVMTAASYWRSAFDELVRAGVHVRTYSYFAVPYIHAKVIIADPNTSEEQMFIGSENFSLSSLYYNRELGLMTKSRSLVAPVAAIVRSDFAKARPWK